MGNIQPFIFPPPGSFGPDGNVGMTGNTHEWRFPIDVTVHFSFSAGWENAICLYDGSNNRLLAESGNYGREGRAQGTVIPAHTKIVVSGWHKKTGPCGQQPWWPSHRSAVTDNEVWFGDAHPTGRNAMCSFKPTYLSRSSAKVNWAVCGTAGTGKSSLINTLRGVKPSDNGAAPVGVTETTAVPTPYDHKNTVVLWDMPGAGTRLVPSADYARNYGLRWFQLVIIVTGSRVFEPDVDTIRYLQQFGVPWIVVRSRMDVDADNNEADHGASVQDTLAQVRALTRQHLQAALPGIEFNEDKLFLVSSRLSRLSSFDDWKRLCSRLGLN